MKEDEVSNCILIEFARIPSSVRKASYVAVVIGVKGDQEQKERPNQVLEEVVEKWGKDQPCHNQEVRERTKQNDKGCVIKEFQNRDKLNDFQAATRRKEVSTAHLSYSAVSIKKFFNTLKGGLNDVRMIDINSGRSGDMAGKSVVTEEERHKVGKFFIKESGDDGRDYDRERGANGGYGENKHGINVLRREAMGA
ncbi:hypothetical protein LguiA_001845 [Lonicera macranthoides]